jgi:hypothetical protein
MSEKCRDCFHDGTPLNDEPCAVCGENKKAPKDSKSLFLLSGEARARKLPDVGDEKTRDAAKAKVTAEAKREAGRAGRS